MDVADCHLYVAKVILSTCQIGAMFCPLGLHSTSVIGTIVGVLKNQPIENTCGYFLSPWILLVSNEEENLP